MAFDIHSLVKYADNQNISSGHTFEKDKMMSCFDAK